MALEDRIRRGETIVESFHPGIPSNRARRAAVTIAEVLCYAAANGIPVEDVIKRAESIFKGGA